MTARAEVAAELKVRMRILLTEIEALRVQLKEFFGESTKLTLSADAVAKELGVSERWVADAMRDGRLPSVKFGRQRVIPFQALVEFIEAGGEQ